MSLMMLSMVFAIIVMSVESARRVCEILDEKSTLHNPENPVYEVRFDHADPAHILLNGLVQIIVFPEYAVKERHRPRHAHDDGRE